MVCEWCSALSDSNYRYHKWHTFFSVPPFSLDVMLVMMLVLMLMKTITHFTSSHFSLLILHHFSFLSGFLRNPQEINQKLTRNHLEITSKSLINHRKITKKSTKNHRKITEKPRNSKYARCLNTENKRSFPAHNTALIKIRNKNDYNRLFFPNQALNPRVSDHTPVTDQDFLCFFFLLVFGRPKSFLFQYELN